MILRCIWTLLAATAVLAGCAQQPQPAPEPEPQPVATPEPEPLPPRPFDADTLYSLLVAEFAGSRGKLDVALANYSQQARKTGDPQVAERAYMIARYLRDDSAALEASLLWAEGDQQDQDAQAAAILGLIEADRLLEALEATRKAKTRDNGALLQSIAASAKEVTPTQREALLATYRELLAESPDNLALLVGTALLLQQQGEVDEAFSLAERATQIDPEHTPAIILLSGLMHQQQHNSRAIALVERHLQDRPDDTRLRLQLARLLTFSDLTRAQQQFQRLADAHPGDADILLALALVAAEREDHEVAEASHRALLEMNAHTSTAHHYLGQQALAAGDTASAVEHFRQVEPGQEFVAATQHILDIYIEASDFARAEEYIQTLATRFPDHHEQLILLYSQSLAEADHREEAIATLTRGLEKFAHSSGLLYARALIHDNRGHLQAALEDLTLLLQYDPNNPTALNALGYILADKTERYDEAQDYIARALEQQPNDPATIDSMGWVLYKQGEHDEALTYLRRAMDIYPDHEIAAHLGEVLWVTGQRDEAREVWRQGLELTPDSPFILDSIERLGADVR